MEMCYDGALVMPKSYAVMDQDEMCYVEGGYYIDVKRSTAANVINGIATIAGFFIGGCTTVAKLVSKFGKNKAIKIWTELAIYLGVKKSQAQAVGKVISAFTGFSIGSGLAYALDIYDKSGDNNRIQF